MLIDVKADRRAKIDRFGELSRQLAEIKPLEKEHKALKAEIRSWYDKEPAGDSLTAEGGLYNLQISPRENETKIRSILKVKSAIGASKFLQVCSITLKAIKDCVTDEVYQGLVITERTGCREITAVAKGPATVAQIAA